ncbi:MAG: efflux RND transporter periplasmic adaptor subunit [Acidobacteria bacterium]|nr:efflux RND transporter periplasmic adaptor subunit [Acidobacteriota bacterium]
MIKGTLLFALLFTAAACTRKAEGEAKTKAATATASPTAAPPVEVSTATAITRAMARSVEVVGSLAADEEVVISAQVPGEVAQINIDFGSFVQAGQVIATLDQRDAKLRIEQAEASLKQTMARLGMTSDKFDPNQAADVKVARASLDWTKMDLERATKLVENGDVARSIYDNALTQNQLAQARHQAALDAVNQQLAVIEQQKSAINLAKKALGDTIVRSPITGAVKEKHTSRGAYLSQQSLRIATLVKINPLRLRADIPEFAAAAVRTGQQMLLEIDAFPGRKFTGRIARIGASLNEQTRALTVEATVANPGNLLRPGMFAKSSLITAPNAQATMIPSKAVVSIAGLTKVFVIENGKAVERIVKTGTKDGDLIEISEGVRTGENVALNNLDKLQTGTTVSNK